jgi:hypothetical protein
MLRARNLRDHGLDEEIAALTARVTGYQHTPNAPTAADAGLVSLMEKLDDGRRVPVQL